MTISLQTKNSMNRATFGQRQASVTDKASRNLSVSSSNINKGTIKLNGTRKGTFTPGVNNADRRTYNYDRARANLNSRPAYTPPSANFGSSLPNISMSNFKLSGAMQSGAKIGMYAGLAFGALNMVNTFAGGGMSAGSALSSAFDGLGGVSTASTLNSQMASDALNAMSQATTAGDLQTAITNASTQLKQMTAADSVLKSNAETAQNNLKGLQDSAAKEKATLKSMQNNKTQKEQTVKGLEGKLNGINSSYTSACAEVTKCETNLATAEQGVTDAGSKLTSAETALKEAQNLPDNDPKKRALINSAQARVDKAKTEKDNAVKAKEAAEQKLEGAKQQRDNLKDSLGKLKEQIETTEKELEAAKKDVEKAKEELEAQENKVKDAEEKLKEANDAISKYTANTQDMAALKKAIADNQKRLPKMQENEKKEMAKLQKEIQKDETQNTELAGQISTGDNRYVKKDGKLQAKIETNNYENQARRDRYAELAQSQLKAVTPKKDKDGNDYRTITIGSETYYSKNNIPITKEEYDTGMAQA